MRTKQQWDVASVFLNRSMFESPEDERPKGTIKLGELLDDDWEPFSVTSLNGERERIYLRKLIDVELED